MSVIYEGEKDSRGLWPQFTNCCGATDKGVDNGVVCRHCYNYIEAYYGVGDEEGNGGAEGGGGNEGDHAAHDNGRDSGQDP